MTPRSLALLVCQDISRDAPQCGTLQGLFDRTGVAGLPCTKYLALFAQVLGAPAGQHALGFRFLDPDGTSLGEVVNPHALPGPEQIVTLTTRTKVTFQAAGTHTAQLVLDGAVLAERPLEVWVIPQG
jgi:hypothetical protein